MHIYLVVISVMIPYPKEYTHRIEASGFGTAINRSFKMMRKDLKGKKRFDTINVKTYRLEGIN